MKTHLLETKALLLATLTAIAASSVACSAQPVVEEKGSTKSKLLAPRPMMKATASPTSHSTLGVAEWRIFRGRNDVVLTGYDEDGKPVKGLSVGFHAASDTDEATLRTRVLDGSMFAARHEYSRSRTVRSTDMPAATASFLQQALADIAVLRQAASRPSTRTFGTSPQCGIDMMTIISNALTCIQNSGGSANTSAASQCIAAAQSAASVGTVCQSTGTTPFDPTSGFDPWDPGMGGFDPMGQPGACGQGADPWGGAQGIPGGMPCGADPWGGQDPYGQGGMGADPWGGQDPYGQGGMGADPYGDIGGWGGGMPTGDWCSDPFGDGAACPSCGGMGGMGGMDDWGGAGGMGDICANPMNGDVGYEGDFGGGDWGAGF